MAEPYPPFPRRGGATPDPESLRAAGIRLRPAQSEDIAALASLYRLARQAELLLAPWSAAEKQAFLDDQFRLQHRHFVGHFAHADFWAITDAGAASNDAPIGRLYLDRSTPIWCLIDILIAPTHQGRALGSALLGWIQEAARDTGAEGVRLHVAINNPRAHALYRRFGFVEMPGGDGMNLPMRWTP